MSKVQVFKRKVAKIYQNKFNFTLSLLVIWLVVLGSWYMAMMTVCPEKAQIFPYTFPSYFLRGAKT